MKRPSLQPAALVCGILTDGERALFLIQKNSLGEESLELPHAFIFAGENPVSSLTSAFLLQTGIDGQVHEIIMQGKFNSGSRKRKRLIPALGFRVSAKSHSAKLLPAFFGYKWLLREEAVKKKLAKTAEWLR
jgi:hypothetical protein